MLSQAAVLIRDLQQRTEAAGLTTESDDLLNVLKATVEELDVFMERLQTEINDQEATEAAEKSGQ